MIALEKVARAMAESRVPGSTQEGGQYFVSEGWRAVLLRDARAALSALKEVDEGTVEAMAMADVPWEFEDSRTGKTVEGPFALELSGPNKIERAGEVARALLVFAISHILGEDHE